MSFTGDLEHLPIVDVIQLLHATKKSGTLCVRGDRGRCQLVFKDGYLVSANHADDSMRIGKILVGRRIIAREVLEQTLLEQRQAGRQRKPLIAMLLERGQVNRDEAFRGLEALIEMTIVEILTWSRGSFALDIGTIQVSDEYRYFPEKLQQEINLDTQMVLMDALRIYDEKKRDGELDEFSVGGLDAQEPAGGAEETPVLTADDLGLADLDRLERKIPEIFSGLADPDPSGRHRQRLRELLADFPPDEQEALVSCLSKVPAPAGADADARQRGRPRAVVLYSWDELLTHAVTAICRQEGALAFATAEAADLAPILDQCLAKAIAPLLVFDAPERSADGFAPEQVAGLRQQMSSRYPQATILQLASPHDSAFFLRSFRDGVGAVLPRPRREERKETFVRDTVDFLETLRYLLQGCHGGQGGEHVSRLRNCVADLEALREAPEISLAVLRFVAGVFVRALTLVVGRTELIAERGIGVGSARGEGVSAPLGLRIPLARPSLLHAVVEQGAIFCGESDDQALQEHLFAAIGAPHRPRILLLPLKSRGRVVALTYGDFGPNEAAPVPIELLEILARQAGLVLENALCRRKLEAARQ